jgi:hypothetical protein
MNIRSRIGKLELACGRNRSLCDLSDPELETRIRRLAGLADDVPLTDDLLHQIIAETKLELREAMQ